MNKMSSTSSTDRSDSYYNHSIRLDEVTKSQKSKGKRVTFDTAQAQIYVLPPEDRRSPWMFMAVDHVRTMRKLRKLLWTYVKQQRT